MTILQAGTARTRITPPIGTPMMGYAARSGVSEGVHDDLYATALVIDDGSRRTVIVSADVIFLHPTTVSAIQTQIHADTGITPDAIFLCCTHTHSGSITYADAQSPQAHQAWVAVLQDRLIACIREANEHLQPVTLHAGRSQADININRRERLPDGKIIIGNNPGGVVDRSVQVVQVKTASGAALATVVNYACHPVVMGPRNLHLSADWVGQMRDHVEASLGGLCLFVQGCTADVNPRHMRHTDADNWDEIESQGRIVGEAVERAAENMQPLLAAPIQFAQQQIWLPLRPVGESNVRQFFPDAESEADARRRMHDLFPWQVSVEARSDGLYSPVAVGGLRIGEWAMVTLGTEPFTETGLSIKASSPIPMTMVAGYSNGCNSYLPVASAYAEGGYEVETAPLVYGLPSPFEKGVAEQISAAAMGLIGALPQPNDTEIVDAFGYPIGFFEETYGSLADDPIDLGPDLPPPVRDEVE